MEKSIELLDQIKSSFELKDVDLRTYSPLTLAYIGDAIFDLVIRSYVVSKGNTSNNNLHKETTRYVSAKSQAVIIEKLMPQLSEEEVSIYRRGKNSKPQSGAKNASMKEYLMATGFEALMGYLYLSNNISRMLELIKIGIEDN